MNNRFQVQLNQNWIEYGQTQPKGWVLLSKHRTLASAQAEINRREHQEGRGFEHRVTDTLGKIFNRVEN